MKEPGSRSIRCDCAASCPLRPATCCGSLRAIFTARRTESAVGGALLGRRRGSALNARPLCRRDTPRYCQIIKNTNRLRRSSLKLLRKTHFFDTPAHLLPLLPPILKKFGAQFCETKRDTRHKKFQKISIRTTEAHTTATET